MKIFALPPVKENLALLFDMDNTLYTHDEFIQKQTELPIRRLAQVKGKTFKQMNDEIIEFRRDWGALHNGQAISLGNVFLSFGISIEESVRWREELIRPEDYLTEDKKLRHTLTLLAARFSLAVVTNNPVSVAVRTLSALGVYDILQKIVGLDTCGVSKPNREIFYKAAQICNVPACQCISIGDRYDIDIALPLELGMGGILVDGAEDVYKIPEILT